MEEKRILNSLFDELFPIMRSITGPGLEQSMNIFCRHMPLEISKVKSGTKVFDWVVPLEWHFKRAKLTGPTGKVICDSNDLNLHVVNYSEAIDKKINLDDLDAHLHSIPELPQAVPYVTSYYKRDWGFCLSHEQRKKLQPGFYHVSIDSKFVNGGVPFAQCKIVGESKKEILLSSYLCHPSLANNELSGPLVLLLLYHRIKKWPKKRYTYRFLINPETIGALCFLSMHKNELVENLISGLILTCLGGPSNHLLYKSSRKKNTLINRVIDYKEKKTLLPIVKTPFTPVNGSDERQYCSPGFNFPVGQLSRSTYGSYKGYHNSLDTKAFMGIGHLIESADTLEQLLKYAEICGKPVNLSPFGEPQLGKRNLYPNMNSNQTRFHSADTFVDGRTQLTRMLTLLNMADGETDLIEISKEAKCSVDELLPTLLQLEEHNLIEF